MNFLFQHLFSPSSWVGELWICFGWQGVKLKDYVPQGNLQQDLARWLSSGQRSIFKMCGTLPGSLIKEGESRTSFFYPRVQWNDWNWRSHLQPLVNTLKVAGQAKKRGLVSWWSWNHHVSSRLHVSGYLSCGRKISSLLVYGTVILLFGCLQANLMTPGGKNMKIPNIEFRVGNTELWGKWECVREESLLSVHRTYKGATYLLGEMKLLRKSCILLCIAIMILQVWAVKCPECIRSIPRWIKRI